MVKVLRRLLTTILLGYTLTGIGSLLNIIAVTGNQGKMPVWCPTEEVRLSVIADPTHEHNVLTMNSKYIILDDILPFTVLTSEGFRIDSVQSIGDEFIFLGYPIFFFSLIGFLLYLPWEIFLILIYSNGRNDKNE